VSSSQIAYNGRALGNQAHALIALVRGSTHSLLFSVPMAVLKSAVLMIRIQFQTTLTLSAFVLNPQDRTRCVP
jgi:hypothetical protein